LDLSRKPPDEVSGRDEELATLTDRAAHGRFVLLHAPRRYGKTSLIGRLAANADATGDLAVVRVDLEGVLTIDDVARRLHDAYRKLPATTLGRLLRRAVDGLASVGFTATRGGVGFQPRRADEATPVLERLLDLPYEAADRVAARVLVVLDEFQAIGPYPMLTPVGGAPPTAKSRPTPGSEHPGRPLPAHRQPRGLLDPRGSPVRIRSSAPESDPGQTIRFPWVPTPPGTCYPGSDLSPGST